MSNSHYRNKFKTKPPPYEVGMDGLACKHVKFSNGKADITVYKPLRFELVFLYDAEDRVKKGWWTGTHFDGLDMKDFIPKYWGLCGSST